MIGRQLELVTLRAAAELATARKDNDRRWRLQQLRAERRTDPSRCPRCGCFATGVRCTIVLAEGLGEAACVPRGVFGFKRCSACL